MGVSLLPVPLTKPKSLLDCSTKRDFDLHESDCARVMMVLPMFLSQFKWFVVKY